MKNAAMKILPILAVLGMASAAMADPLPQLRQQFSHLPQDSEQCSAQPNVPWCRGDLQVQGRIPTEADIKTNERFVRRNFTDVTEVGPDIFRSHYDTIQGEAAWSGDCDDLVSTVLENLVEAGFDATRMRRVAVSIHRDGVPDHMVGLVEDSQGRTWVVGDINEDGVYPLRNMRYDIMLVSSIEGRRAGLPYWNRTAR